MRLAGTDLEVSPLGFGTAALGRSLSRRERLRLLEVAFDCGITHFDTAPLYGAGAAEEALGAFLRGHPSGVTVATKVGIEPPRLTRLALSRLGLGAAAPRGGRFAPAEVRASLERSLRRLRTSRVDILLLHEVRAVDLTDALREALAAVLEDGLVGCIGTATSAAETAAILANAHDLPAVVQASRWPEPPDVGSRGLILHSIVAGRSGSPGEILVETRREHPLALLLFGSREPSHVRETITAYTAARA